MTRSRSRVHGILRWFCLVMTLFMLGAWAASLFWDIQRRRDLYEKGPDNHYVEHRIILALQAGSVGLHTAIAHMSDNDPLVKQEKPIVLWRAEPAVSVFQVWWPSFQADNYSGGFSLVVPLWLPTLLFALPTALLFYRDHRRLPPNHCPHCRYNLHGLPPTAPCPECGKGAATS